MTNRLKDLSFSMGDRLFGLFAILCGYLYWTLPGGHGKGLGGTLLVVIMVAFRFVYTYSCGYKHRTRGAFSPLGASFYAVQTSLFSIMFWNDIWHSSLLKWPTSTGLPLPWGTC